jgi:transcriptional regulator NrdR family protein
MAPDADTRKRGHATRGLVCESCGGQCWRVVYTRGRDEGVIQRLRTCRTCGQKIVTWETRIPT